MAYVCKETGISAPNFSPHWPLLAIWPAQEKIDRKYILKKIIPKLKFICQYCLACILHWTYECKKVSPKYEMSQIVWSFLLLQLRQIFSSKYQCWSFWWQLGWHKSKFSNFHPDLNLDINPTFISEHKSPGVQQCLARSLFQFLKQSGKYDMSISSFQIRRIQYLCR